MAGPGRCSSRNGRADQLEAQRRAGRRGSKRRRRPAPPEGCAVQALGSGDPTALTAVLTGYRGELLSDDRDDTWTFDRREQLQFRYRELRRRAGLRQAWQTARSGRTLGIGKGSVGVAAGGGGARRRRARPARPCCDDVDEPFGPVAEAIIDDAGVLADDELARAADRCAGGPSRDVQLRWGRGSSKHTGAVIERWRRRTQGHRRRCCPGAGRRARHHPGARCCRRARNGSRRRPSHGRRGRRRNDRTRSLSTPLRPSTRSARRRHVAT